MKRLLPLLLVSLLAGSASAKPARHKTARRATPASKRAPARPAPAPADNDSGGETATAAAGGASAGETSVASAGVAPGTKIKTKTYTFGAMDVEGKLKTPQLLYFLNRVKLELDMSAPDKRSFMKELAQSADDRSL